MLEFQKGRPGPAGEVNDIRVIIVNKDREKDLKDCLNSIIKQTYQYKEINKYNRKSRG